MIIPLDQILEDEEVKRAICLIVQAELEKMNKSLSQKVHQLELSEQENFFLKSKLIELERDGLRKDVGIRELRRELQNERARIKIIINTKTGSSSREIHYSSDSTSSTPPVKRMLNFDADPGLTLANPSSPFQGHTDNTTTDKEVNSFVHEQDMTTSPEKWICSCGTQFKCRPYLFRHIRYYHGDKKFKCSKCTDAHFALATDLRKHLKAVHKLPPAPWMRYACHDCGSFFATGTELWAHRSKDHSKMFKSNPVTPATPKPSQIIALKNIKKEKEDTSTCSSVVSSDSKAKMHRKQKKFHGFVKALNVNVTKVSKKYTSLPHM